MTTNSLDDFIEKYIPISEDEPAREWTEIKADAKAAIETLINQEVQKAHDLYPDKEEYYAKSLVEKKINQAKIEELNNLQEAHKTGAFYSLIISDRIKELKAKELK